MGDNGPNKKTKLHDSHRVLMSYGQADKWMEI